jgi:hypothetical protein
MLRGYNVFVSYPDPDKAGGRDQIAIDEIETRGGKVVDFQHEDGIRKLRGFFESEKGEEVWSYEAAYYCDTALQAAGFTVSVNRVDDIGAAEDYGVTSPEAARNLGISPASAYHPGPTGATGPGPYRDGRMDGCTGANPTDDYLAGLEHQYWSEGYDEGFDEGVAEAEASVSEYAQHLADNALLIGFREGFEEGRRQGQAELLHALTHNLKRAKALYRLAKALAK